MRGRWHLLRRHGRTLRRLRRRSRWRCTQFVYFSAVAHMEVAPALLIEFTAPAAVVVWLWLRHGERPGRVTRGRCRAGGARPGAGARPAVGRRPRACRRAVVAGRDGRVRDVLRDVGRRGQRPAADRPGRRRAASSARCRWPCSAWSGCSTWRPRRRRSTSPARRSPGGCPIVLLGVVTAAVPTSPGSRPSGGWARGWRRSSRCSRWCSGCCGRGCCSTSCRAPVQLLGGVLILAGVVAVKLGERTTARPAA